MPVFLIPILLWGGAAAAAAALVAGGFWIFRAQGGVTVSVLGPRQSGKSTLVHFLTTGKVRTAYIPTAQTDEVKMQLFGQKTMLKVKDLGGSKDHLKAWKHAAEASNYVWFVVRVTDLKDPGRKKDIERYARQVGSWRLEAKTILIGTHADLADSWVPDRAETLGQIAELRKIKQLLAADSLIVGSLAKTAEAKRLESQLQAGMCLV